MDYLPIFLSALVLAGLFWLSFRTPILPAFQVTGLYLIGLITLLMALSLFFEPLGHFPLDPRWLAPPLLPAIVSLLAGFGFRRFYKMTLPIAGLLFLSLFCGLAQTLPEAWFGFSWIGRLALGGFLLHALFSFWMDRKDDMDLRRRRARFFLTGYCAITLVIGLIYSPFHAQSILHLCALWAVTFFSIQYANRPPKDVLIDRFDEILEQFTHLFSSRRLYREEDLNLDRIGDRLLLDNTKTRFLIHRGTGYRRLSDMLDEYRVAAAKEILCDIEQAQTPLSEVAIYVGYGSVEPLQGAFERLTGEDPRAFRLAHNREADANRPLQLTNSDR